MFFLASAALAAPDLQIADLHVVNQSVVFEVVNDGDAASKSTWLDAYSDVDNLAAGRIGEEYAWVPALKPGATVTLELSLCKDACWFVLDGDGSSGDDVLDANLVAIENAQTAFDSYDMPSTPTIYCKITRLRVSAGLAEQLRRRGLGGQIKGPDGNGDYYVEVYHFCHLVPAP